jgi:hypothetical protein
VTVRPLGPANFRRWIERARSVAGTHAWQQPLYQGNSRNRIGNILLAFAPDEAPPEFEAPLEAWSSLPEPNPLRAAVLWKLGLRDKLAVECAAIEAACRPIASQHHLEPVALGAPSPLGAQAQVVAARMFLSDWPAAVTEQKAMCELVRRLWPNTSSVGFSDAELHLLEACASNAEGLPGDAVAMVVKEYSWPLVEGTLTAERLRFVLCRGEQDRLRSVCGSATPPR